MLLGMALLTLGGIAVWVWGVNRPDTITTNVARLVIVPPDTAPLDFETDRSALALAPDGNSVVYVSRPPDASGPALYLRPLDQVDGAPIPGGEGGYGPFFSAISEFPK